jgi:hypothetical protein
MSVEYEVEQSAWLKRLEEAGLGRRFLIELNLNDLRLPEEFRPALRHFDEARSGYARGEWRKAVESLGQSLAILGRTAPEAEETDAEVKEAIKSIKRPPAIDRSILGNAWN